MGKEVPRLKPVTESGGIRVIFLAIKGSETGFYCNFGRRIQFRGLFDHTKNFWALFGHFSGPFWPILGFEAKR